MNRKAVLFAAVWCLVFLLGSGLWFATTWCLCGAAQKGVNPVWENRNCSLLHHHSEAVHQTERRGLTGWKLCLSSAVTKERQGIAALCFWLSSVIWKRDPVSQPGRKQVLSPVVLLSHYTSCGLKVEPAPVNIPQWLWKKKKCRSKKKKHCSEIRMFHAGAEKK